MFSRSFHQFVKPRSSGIHFFSQKNFQGNAKAWPCEIVKITFQPNKNMMDLLPIKSNTGFIRSPQGLDFVNKLHQIISPIKASETALESFDKAMNPTNESRSISENELDIVESITGFSLPVHYCPQEDTKQMLEGMSKLQTWADNERNNPGSTMGPW